MFHSVLVANRGEIAVRIITCLQEMQIEAVAVFSPVDCNAPHVRLADRALPLRGNPAGESYLDIAQIVEAARASGVDAVHPGYGFLSENSRFAAALEGAGIKLIGPSAAVIHAMGDKVEARRRMEAAGVPVVPGWHGDEADTAFLHAQAERIGFPLLVKAAAGGGGKGMRLAETEAELDGAVHDARSEAEKAFGDPRVFLEKFLARSRHVEVQVFGDAHGNACHLWERECSIQRRHQKIVEESPSPALSAELRARMTAAAVQVVHAVGYENAGTVEFILDEDGEFYFLEVNTRLQVEHPVTELVTGHDLVRAQIQVAAGEALPFRQQDIPQVGHALECRIYAEDPARGFLPDTGILRVYREPRGPGIRVESGVREGSEVSVFYDPLLSKLVVWAATRQQALARMEWALAHFPVLGVRTNIEFLARLMRHPEFRAGHLHTHFLDEHSLVPPPGPPPLEVLAAAALSSQQAPAANGGPTTLPAARATPWQTAGSWRLSGTGEGVG